MLEIITMSKGKDSLKQRNAIQAQYKEHREKLDMSVAEVKAIRAEQNLHKKRRDAIQAQIRDLIGQAKAQRGDRNDKKSASFEFNKLASEVDNMEKDIRNSWRNVFKERERDYGENQKHASSHERIRTRSRKTPINQSRFV